MSLVGTSSLARLPVTAMPHSSSQPAVCCWDKEQNQTDVEEAFSTWHVSLQFITCHKPLRGSHDIGSWQGERWQGASWWNVTHTHAMWNCTELTANTKHLPEFLHLLYTVLIISRFRICSDPLFLCQHIMTDVRWKPSTNDDDLCHFFLKLPTFFFFLHKTSEIICYNLPLLFLRLFLCLSQNKRWEQRGITGVVVLLMKIYLTWLIIWLWSHSPTPSSCSDCSSGSYSNRQPIKYTLTLKKITDVAPLKWFHTGHK